MKLKKIFDDWAESCCRDYSRRQWLLSKWEMFEAIEWSEEKKNILIQNILENLRLRPSENLLDLGCGGGWILQSLTPQVKKAVGLDFSWNMNGSPFQNNQGQKNVTLRQTGGNGGVSLISLSVKNTNKLMQTANAQSSIVLSGNTQ